MPDAEPGYDPLPPEPPPEQYVVWTPESLPPEEGITAVQIAPPDLTLVPTVELVPRVGWSIPAWLLILALVGFEVWQGLQPPREVANAPTLDVNLLVLRFQGRYLVGAAQMRFANGKDLLEQTEFDLDSEEAQLYYIVLEGELDSPITAVGALQNMAEPFVWDEATQRTAKLRKLLLRVYEDQAAGLWHAPSLEAQERQYLETQMGWYGKLALTPAKHPDRRQRAEVIAVARHTVTGLVVGMLGLILCGFLGLIGLFLFLVFALLGRVRGGLTLGSPYGGVYAETFALWMASFVVISFLANGTLAHLVPQEDLLLVNGMVGLGSLVFLAWPVLRGVPWRQVREDIGLTLGRRPWLEPFLGLGVYVMTLPLLAVGLLFMVALKQLGLGGQPLAVADGVHPIIFELPQASGWKLFQVFFLACVVAPVAEEIMFRGVLYRQFRESTHRLGQAFSVFSGAFVISFLFAVIHPQGLIAVPVLMALAIGFTLAREWRGTLIPGIIAHGLNNGLALSLAVWFLRG